MKVLITGSSGFLGSQLVQELSKQEDLTLKTVDHPIFYEELHHDHLIEGLDIERVRADLSDRQQAYQAVYDCQLIFHTEQLMSFRAQDKLKMDQINLQATQNLLEAATRNGVDRFIHVAGLETLTHAPGEKFITEKDGVLFEELQTHFEKTRFLAEKEVFKFRQQGLATVIVHPTFMVGAGEKHKTLFGKFIHRLLKGKVHFYIDSGFNLVDVRDVAKGCLLAAKRGEPGSRYILGNQNLYLLEFLQNFEAFSGARTPRTALPLSLAESGNFVAQSLLGRRQGIPNAILRRFRRPLFYTTDLAKRELGMPQSNVWEALKKQIDELKKLDFQ